MDSRCNQKNRWYRYHPQTFLRYIFEGIAQNQWHHHSSNLTFFLFCRFSLVCIGRKEEEDSKLLRTGLLLKQWNCLPVSDPTSMFLKCYQEAEYSKHVAPSVWVMLSHHSGINEEPKLRRYTATVSQVIDLNSSEIEWLAGRIISFRSIPRCWIGVSRCKQFRLD